MFEKLEIGQLFKEDVTNYQEGVKFDFSQTGAGLYLFYKSPKIKEIEEIKSGKLQVAIYIKKDIIFTMFKFGSMNWVDAPYNVHLSAPFEFEELEDRLGYSLSIFLVDASTGMIKAIRYVGLPNKYSQKLKIAIEEQKTNLFDEQRYRDNIKEIYRDYSTENMVVRADICVRV